MMANNVTNNPLLNALFRIDPTTGLVEYVQTVKPYHTKVLDVLVEYVFEEKVDVTVFDGWCWNVDIVSAGPAQGLNVVTDCGFGSMWSVPSPAVSLQIIEAGKDPSTIPLSEPDPTRYLNSFLVEQEPFPEYTFVVSSESMNIFEFVPTTLVIIESNIGLNSFYVSGNQTPAFSVGELFVVIGTANAGTYTIAGVEFDSINNRTRIIVQESIPASLIPSGTTTITVPSWLPGFAVKVTAGAGDSLPTPLSSAQTYHYIPITSSFGKFALATKRYPTEQTDYVNITDSGVGSTFKIQKNEFLYPGAEFEIQDSTNHLNDGILISVIEADSPSKYFYVSGNKTALFPTGKSFRVVNSAANNGKYTVVNSVYMKPIDLTDRTRIEVVESIPVSNLNDGQIVIVYLYTVYGTLPTDSPPYVRVQVMQEIKQPTYLNFPVPSTDGTLTYSEYGGFDAPQVCFPSQTPEFWTQGYINERIEMVFSDDPLNPIIITAATRQMEPPKDSSNLTLFDVNPFDE